MSTLELTPINRTKETTMALNKKIILPLTLLLLALVAAGGWWFLRQKPPEKPQSAQTAVTHGKQLYTCSMHPNIIRDKPGACPICGMELIRKIETPAAPSTQQATEQGAPAATARLTLSQGQRIMANVATVEARTETLNREINAVGIVQYDQSRQAKVTAWAAGRLEKLYVNSVGAFISKERALGELYSPDLLATQEEYLLAIKSRKQLQNSPLASISGDGMVASARMRLKLLGVKESQIAELERSGKANLTIPIYSPFSGIVIEKMVQQGEYVTAGQVLFNIADLSKVWVEAEVYENELQSIAIGQPVEIRSRSLGAKTLTGRIAFIYPFLDPKTRSIKVRVEMANPGMILKPEMFVNAVIKVGLKEAIVVPLSALIDTGKRRVVWVESSPGVFESRNVQAGGQSGDKIQIVSGLRAGEKVAISGGYLIDAESQLNGSSH